MKVLVFTNMWPYEEDPSYGIFIKEQADSLRRRGVMVDVLFLNGRESKLNYLKGIVQFLRKLRSNKYDLIHTHHTYCAAIAQLQRRHPVVLTLHEGEALHTIGILQRIKDYGLFKVPVFSCHLKRLIGRQVQFAVAVSSQIAAELGLRKAQVLSCGIDLERFKPLSLRESRLRIGLPVGGKIVLFPASPSRRGKRFDVVQDAVQMVKKTTPNVRLLTLAEVPHDLVPWYMNASDVLALSSDYEASPMVIKEALAVNLPIVSTDVGDVRKLIGGADGCFICNGYPTDFARNLEKALQFGRSTTGRERVLALGFGLDQVAESLVRLYRKAVGGKR